MRSLLSRATCRLYLDCYSGCGKVIIWSSLAAFVLRNGVTCSDLSHNSPCSAIVTFEMHCTAQWYRSYEVRAACHIFKAEHCSLFIVLLKIQQALLFESIWVRRQSNLMFCVSITVLKIFVYNCGRTRTVANPQKSVQCMCCGFLVVRNQNFRNMHHGRIK